jgi:hypothetical protein
MDLASNKEFKSKTETLMKAGAKPPYLVPSTPKRSSKEWSFATGSLNEAGEKACSAPSSKFVDYRQQLIQDSKP